MCVLVGALKILLDFQLAVKCLEDGWEKHRRKVEEDEIEPPLSSKLFFEAILQKPKVLFKGLRCICL